MKTTKTILVVDEDPEVRECLRGVLESSGYQVLVAGSGRDTFERLDPMRLDAMVLDVSFLLRHGWDAYIRFAFTRPNLPIILLNGQAGHLEYPMPSNVRFHIDKPFDAPLLLDAVQRVLNGSEPDPDDPPTCAAPAGDASTRAIHWEPAPRWKPRFGRRWQWTSGL